MVYPPVLVDYSGEYEHTTWESIFGVGHLEFQV